jgi:hypothetical protein
MLLQLSRKFDQGNQIFLPTKYHAIVDISKDADTKKKKFFIVSNGILFALVNK